MKKKKKCFKQKKNVDALKGFVYNLKATFFQELERNQLIHTIVLLLQSFSSLVLHKDALLWFTCVLLYYEL